eukprot:53419-Pleurochrysis_carterae.AAC.1
MLAAITRHCACCDGCSLRASDLAGSTDNRTIRLIATRHFSAHVDDPATALEQFTFHASQLGPGASHHPNTSLKTR